MVRMSLFVMIFLVLAVFACYANPTPGDAAGSSWDRHIIYHALIFFWIGIIGLIVIIVMKLKEVKRIQDMDVHKDDDDAPFLD